MKRILIFLLLPFAALAQTVKLNSSDSQNFQVTAPYLDFFPAGSSYHLQFTPPLASAFTATAVQQLLPQSGVIPALFSVGSNCANTPTIALPATAWLVTCTPGYNPVMTIPNGTTDGQLLYVVLIQPGSGYWYPTWPSNVNNAANIAVDPTAFKATVVPLIWDAQTAVWRDSNPVSLLQLSGFAGVPGNFMQFKPYVLWNPTPNAGGASYVVNDVVGITQTTCTGATATVTKVASGAVTALTQLTPGTGAGCITATGLATTGGSGTGLTVNVVYTNPGIADSGVASASVVSTSANNTFTGRNTFSVTSNLTTPSLSLAIPLASSQTATTSPALAIYDSASQPTWVTGGSSSGSLEKMGIGSGAEDFITGYSGGTLAYLWRIDHSGIFYSPEYCPGSGCTTGFVNIQPWFKSPGMQSTGTKFTTSGSTSSTTGGATAGKMTLSANSVSITITMNGATGLTATNGWSCHANDQTTAAGNTGLYFSSSNATTAVMVVPATAGTTDVIDFACTAF